MMLRRSAQGFTLLELLLVVGLLAMILTGVYQIFDDWLQRAVNRQAATDTLRLQQAAMDYVYTNYDTLKDDAIGDFTEVDIALLTANNFLPSAYIARNAFRQPMRVFKRARTVQRIDSDGNVLLDENGNIMLFTTIDVLTISDDPPSGPLRAANSRILDAALAGGPQMGIYSDIVERGASFTGRIASPYRGWNFMPAVLASAGYTADPHPDEGGYLAAFAIVDGERVEVNDNYLYRVNIENRPDLNRMQADLFMNSNAIEDTGTMVADKVIVTGNAAFRGNTQGQPTETSQAMTVDQALRIDGAGETRLNMRSSDCTFDASRNISAPAGCSVQGGELQVISANEDALLNVTGAFNSDGSIITDETYANGNVQSRGVSTFNMVDGHTLGVSNTAIAPMTNIVGTSQISTTELQTSAMAVNGMNLSGNAVEVQGALVAASVRPDGDGNLATYNAGTDVRTFTTDDLELGNSAIFSRNVIAQNAVVNDLDFGAINISPGTDHLPTYGNTAGSATIRDTVLNRNVVCRYFVAGPGNSPPARTYCEPTGQAAWEWPVPVASGGRRYRANCAIGQNANGTTFVGTLSGYGCNHTQEIPVNSNTWVNIGYCNYTRALEDADGAGPGTDLKAVHTSTCVPLL